MPVAVMMLQRTSPTATPLRRPRLRVCHSETDSEGRPGGCQDGRTVRVDLKEARGREDDRRRTVSELLLAAAPSISPPLLPLLADSPLLLRLLPSLPELVTVISETVRWSAPNLGRCDSERWEARLVEEGPRDTACETLMCE